MLMMFVPHRKDQLKEGGECRKESTGGQIGKRTQGVCSSCRLEDALLKEVYTKR
jgi:hypothetical protein